MKAQFTIDPKSREFKDLQSVCEPGNPWRCLIATMGSMHVGGRLAVKLDHDNKSGVIAVTEGDKRYSRPMLPEEVKFATDFDLGKPVRKPLTVRIDLTDGTWSSAPKRGVDGVRPGGPRSKVRNGNSKPRTKTIRQRQLRAIRENHERLSGYAL